jgi:hypothetical protein
MAHFRRSFLNLAAYNLDLTGRAVTSVGSNSAETVDYVHSLDDLSDMR